MSVKLLAALIVAATVTFAIGVAIERAQEPEDASGEAAHVEGQGTEGAPTGEGAESAATLEAEGQSSEATGESSHSDSREKLLGIDPESVGLVIVAVIVSLALAAAVWLRPDFPGLLLMVGLVMAVFAALDVREFIHQLDESRGGLAVLVAAVTLLHAGAAVVVIELNRAPKSAPA